MKHIKSYKIFESRIEDLEDNVKDILLELEDEGFQIEISRISKDVYLKVGYISYYQRTDVFLEVRISRSWDSPKGGIIIWGEIKDVIIRLTEWYYSQSIYRPIDKETVYRTDKDAVRSTKSLSEILPSDSPLRFFNGGIEFGIGWSKEEDFTLGDFIRNKPENDFSNLRMEIKL